MDVDGCVMVVWVLLVDWNGVWYCRWVVEWLVDGVNLYLSE